MKSTDELRARFLQGLPEMTEYVPRRPYTGKIIIRELQCPNRDTTSKNATTHVLLDQFPRPLIELLDPW